jgi:hypothetical protein
MENFHSFLWGGIWQGKFKYCFNWHDYRLPILSVNRFLKDLLCPGPILILEVWLTGMVRIPKEFRQWHW